MSTEFKVDGKNYIRHDSGNVSKVTTGTFGGRKYEATGFSAKNDADAFNAAKAHERGK